MVPRIHARWEAVKIHTAKCDLCNEHNTDVCYRCVECSFHVCTPCKSRGPPDRHHVLPGDSISGPSDGDAPISGSTVESAPKQASPVTRQSRETARRPLRASCRQTITASTSSPPVGKFHSTLTRTPRKRRRVDDSLDETEDDDETHNLPAKAPTSSENRPTSRARTASPVARSLETTAGSATQTNTDVRSAVDYVLGLANTQGSVDRTNLDLLAEVASANPPAVAAIRGNVLVPKYRSSSSVMPKDNSDSVKQPLLGNKTSDHVKGDKNKQENEDQDKNIKQHISKGKAASTTAPGDAIDLTGDDNNATPTPLMPKPSIGTSQYGIPIKYVLMHTMFMAKHADQTGRPIFERDWACQENVSAAKAEELYASARTMIHVVPDTDSILKV